MSLSYEAHASALAAKRKTVTGSGSKVSAPPIRRREEDADADVDVDVDVERKSFVQLGLDTSFVNALRTAFPAVESPTSVQEKLIPEVLLGKKDILLKDDTGSGKTFGLVLGLLNKPRRVVHDDEREGGKRRVVTTLFVVPHRDLALQVMHWVERLTEALKPSAPPLASIAQVLVRGGGWDTRKVVEELKKTAPHMLICTPQALMEVYKEDAGALGLDTLSAVVVDEVDYLVEIDRRKMEKHGGVTREVLDVIYGKRKELREKEEDFEDEDEGESRWREEVEEEMPQLILSSATLRVHFKNYLFEESGWLNPRKVVKIRGEKREGRIEHSILVVSEDGVVNAEGAERSGCEEFAREEMEDAEETEAPDQATTRAYYNQKYGRTPSPFGINTLEAIAAAFAFDVPSIGLLVIPSSAPVHRAVYELRQLGIDAEGLDLSLERRGRGYLLGDNPSGRPRLLVSTPATTRGVDLPELSHVFLLGLPEGRTVEGYTHIAGRVGRFGRRGRVISVVSPAESERMSRVLKAIGERVIRFEHFD